MHRRSPERAFRGTLAILLAVAFAGTWLAGCGGERADESVPPDTADGGEAASLPYDFSSEQAEAVSRFLRGRRGWRLVTASDNENPLLERQQRDDPGYEPYFVEGDLTGDDAPDFALAFDTGDGWRVVWFRRADRGYVQGQPVIHADWLDEGGLFVRDGDLVLGTFFTDRLQIYRWEPESNRLRHVTPEAPELR